MKILIEESVLRQALEALELRCGTNAHERDELIPALRERLTDDHGRSTRRPEGAQCVTDDGRLAWVGPSHPHQQGEFFLDGVNLGSITLEQAMCAYKGEL